MAIHNKLGQWGEQEAVNFLLNKQLEILERNFRYKRSEIDIIAQDQNLLLFIEVKVRSTPNFGLPEIFVTPNKAALIKMAAENYIYAINWKGDIRFDIVSILTKNRGLSPEITYIKDAFS